MLRRCRWCSQRRRLGLCHRLRCAAAVRVRAGDARSACIETTPTALPLAAPFALERSSCHSTAWHTRQAVRSSVPGPIAVCCARESAPCSVDVAGAHSGGDGRSACIETTATALPLAARFALERSSCRSTACGVALRRLQVLSAKPTPLRCTHKPPTWCQCGARANAVLVRRAT